MYLCNNRSYPYLKLKTIIGRHKKFFTAGVIFGVLAVLIFNFSGCSSGSSAPATDSNTNTNSTIDIDTGPDNNSDADFWGGYTFDELMAMEDYEFETISEYWTEDDWDMWTRAAAEYYEDQYLAEEDPITYSVYTPSSPYYNEPSNSISYDRFYYRAQCYDYTHHLEMIQTDYLNVYSKMMREYNNLGLWPIVQYMTLVDVYYGADYTNALGYIELPNKNSAVMLRFSEPAEVAVGDAITVYGTLIQAFYYSNGVEKQCPGIDVYDFHRGYLTGTWLNGASSEPVAMPSMPTWLYEFWFGGATYYDKDGNSYVIDGQSINGHPFEIYNYNLEATIGRFILKIRFTEGEYSSSDTYTVLEFIYGKMHTYKSASDRNAAHNLPDVYNIPYAHQSLFVY